MKAWKHKFSNMKSLRQKPAVLVLIVGLAALALFFLLKGFGGHSLLHLGGKPASEAENVMYQCPMHPQIIQDHPGKCPICHMELQPLAQKKAGKGPAENVEEGSKEPLFYRHPMNPSITSPVPAKDDMGMPFIPVYEKPPLSEVQGRAPVDVDLYQQQLIGVTLGKAEIKPLRKEIYTVGRIAYDPGLYQAQQEYLSLFNSLKLAEKNPESYALEQARSLLQAAVLRLRLLGMSEEQIETLKSKGQPDLSLLMTPESGKVWMYADIYEQEISIIGPGETVVATIPSRPGKEFKGSIVAMDPVVDPKTRTVRIRAELENRERLLRPGMYANAAIQVDLGERLVVPETAVLHTGKRHIVYVAKGDGRFEPHEIQVGLRGEGWVEVLAGLSAGDKIATSGNFLIDAESQLLGTASGSSFYGGQETASGEPNAK